MTEPSEDEFRDAATRFCELMKTLTVDAEEGGRNMLTAMKELGTTWRDEG